MGNNKWQGVIFDLDGVIIDSHPLHKRAWRKFFASLGMNLSESDLEFVLDGRRREDILRHFLGDLAQDRFREYGCLKDRILREEEKEVATVCGFMEFFALLQSAGIPAAVGTSASQERALDILVRFRLKHLFTTIVTGNDILNGKPDPAVFQLAARQLNASPESVLVVEDAVSGVLAAKRAGMKCLGIANHEREEGLRRSGADLVVRDFVGLSLREIQMLF